MKKQFLVPVDFSERADNAVQQAIQLASKMNGEIIFFHAYHRPVSGEGFSHSLSETEKMIDDNFKNLLKRHAALKNIPHEFRKELGVSVDKIVELTEKESIDLLVMATKGAKGVDELWGTKTAKIVKMVEVPVLVIPDNTTLDHLKKLSLACDYSIPTHDKHISFLLDMADQFGLLIDVVTLNRDEKTMTKKEVENRQSLVKQLEKVEASFSHTEHSNIEQGIIAYGKANQIDMIAIMPKSYSYIERLFRESITDKMTFHSPIPLLILK